MSNPHLWFPLDLRRNPPADRIALDWRVIKWPRVLHCCVDGVQCHGLWAFTYSPSRDGQGKTKKRNLPSFSSSRKSASTLTCLVSAFVGQVMVMSFVVNEKWNFTADSKEYYLTRDTRTFLKGFLIQSIESEYNDQESLFLEIYTSWELIKGFMREFLITFNSTAL